MYEEDLLVHNSNAVGAFDDLRWVLARSQKHGRNDIGRVSIESTHRTRHGGSDEVL